MSRTGKAISQLALPAPLSAPAEQELARFANAYEDYLRSASEADALQAAAPKMFILWLLRDAFCSGAKELAAVYEWNVDVATMVQALVTDKWLRQEVDAHGNPVDIYRLTTAGTTEISRFPRTPDQKVLWAEMEQIARRRHVVFKEKAPPDQRALPRDDQAYEEAADMQTVGLAFSGGGIRSATFNLGFLQGLADLGLLKYVDYLSTVSGGGYIGSWFTTWIQHAGLATVERELQPNRLAQAPPDGVGKPQAEPDEPAPIFHLRRFSNYLSPKLGLMSADMWTLLAIYLRNLLACQMVLLPAVVGILLICRFMMLCYHTETHEAAVHAVVDGLAKYVKIDPIFKVRADQIIVGALMAVLWFSASYFAFNGSASVRAEGMKPDWERDKKRLTQRRLIKWVIAPLLITAVLFCWLPGLRLFEMNNSPEPEPFEWPKDWGFRLSFPQWCLYIVPAFLFIPAAVVLAAYWTSAAVHHHRSRRLVHSVGIVLACILGGTLLFGVWSLLLWLSEPAPGDLVDFVHARAAARVTTLGPPLVLAVFSLAIFFGVILLRGSIGEELREWWSKVSAWLMIFGLGWLVVNFVAIYATAVVLWAGPWVQLALGSGWFMTVIAGVFAGGSSSTSVTKPNGNWLDRLATVAPAIFLAGLVIGVSMLLHLVLDRAPDLDGIVDKARWMRRQEPIHPPTRLVNTTTKTKIDSDKTERTTERKEVVERSLVFDGPAVASLLYWVSMFNTDDDPDFKPGPTFYLRRADIDFLKEKKGIKKDVIDKLNTCADCREPAKSYGEFFNNFKEAFMLLPRGEQGQIDKDAIIAIAENFKLIVFSPKMLILKLLAAMLICGIVFGVAIAVVDVNRFSLHALYGNRLTRAYLGASNIQRSPDPFSGFDPGDDVKVSDLTIKESPDKAGYNGPYLLINTALNLVAGSELAWQERKAESFVMTPLVCGSQDTGYCATREYADDLRLSTAMTISGAAASPNSGYSSSPAVTALLTVFNARLGAWLGNPNQEDSRNKTSPTSGFLYLLRELLGLTHSESKYVYLSDGGHFENLGAYELVRRRCRYVIVSDADADGGHVFENLGNLIHKCRADFGIRIEIDLEALSLAAANGRTRWHCAVGKIRYDDVDYGAMPGTLIYVKPSLTGDEPADILHYRTAHPTFPHETTVDQFFNESQFESYRVLGLHIAGAILGDALDDVKREVMAIEGLFTDPAEYAHEHRRISCRALFTSVARRWFALPPGYESSFIHTTNSYSEMQKSFAEDKELHPISLSMYPEVKTPTPVTPSGPAALVSANGADPAPVEIATLLRMLQILENAWLSLNLDVCYAHPLNRGWMDVFYRWTTSPLFRKYWPVLRVEFSRNFVAFCERQLRTGTAGMELQEMARGAPIPEILLREFRTQWPIASAVIGLPDQLNDAARGWLVYTRMNGATNEAAAHEAPVGIILISAASTEEPARDALPTFDVVIWIRGAYRNIGIGRESLRAVLVQMVKEWKGSYRMRVTLPLSQLQGPGGALLKQMWLTFFHNLDFKRFPAPLIKPKGPHVAMDSDVVLERIFEYQSVR